MESRLFITSWWLSTYWISSLKRMPRSIAHGDPLVLSRWPRLLASYSNTSLSSISIYHNMPSHYIDLFKLHPCFPCHDVTGLLACRCSTPCSLYVCTSWRMQTMLFLWKSSSRQDISWSPSPNPNPTGAVVQADNTPLYQKGYRKYRHQYLFM